MLNQYIIDYLKKNKDRFSFGVLKQKLLKAGYPNHQIEEAREIVYQGREEIVALPSLISKPKKAINFWDFWHKKVYTSGKEKILDFITGFIFVIILGILRFLFNIMDLYEIFHYISYFVIYLVLIIYFLIKRKYIAFGMICNFLFFLIT